MESVSIAVVLERIQAEFRELPGLRLTERQAQRLWALEPARCAGVIGALVDAKVLRRTADGAVVAGPGAGAGPR
jgi:hypothetical protein